MSVQGRSYRKFSESYSDDIALKWKFMWHLQWKKPNTIYRPHYVRVRLIQVPSIRSQNSRKNYVTISRTYAHHIFVLFMVQAVNSERDKFVFYLTTIQRAKRGSCREVTSGSITELLKVDCGKPSIFSRKSRFRAKLWTADFPSSKQYC